MNLPARHRKIILAAAILLMVAVGFGFTIKTVGAQTPQPNPVTTAFGRIGSTIGSKLSDATIGIAILYGILYFLSWFFHWLVGIAAGLLNYFYYINIVLVPSQILVVQQGWTILRDLANAIFILITLWIAITIIFNLDNLGGKKLLIRVIIIALLLNFSLTAVTAVFAFANQLARPFSQALGLDPFTGKDKKILENGIAGYIVDKTHIQTVDETINKGAIEDLKSQINAPLQIETSQSNRGQWFAGLQESVMPQPIQTAHAIEAQTIAGTTAAALCAGIAGYTGAALFGALAVCSSVYTAAAQITASLTGTNGPIETVLGILINLAVIDLLLGLTAVALLAAAILLIVRVIAMIFIGVFAPIAFTAYIIPARYGERFWNLWLDNLFRWAFVAPIFYFLLYLSLLMLQTTAVSQRGVPSLVSVPLQANAFYIFTLVLFLVFLWASIFLTRRAAGMGAEAALNLGKRFAGFGLGVATGGLAFGAASLARRGAPALQKMIKSPFLSRTILARRTGAYLERQKAKIAPHEAELKDASDDRLVQEYQSAIRAERKVAIANMLASHGKFSKLGAEEQTQALRLASQFGPQSVQSILKARPDLASENNVAKEDIDKQIAKAAGEGRTISQKEAAQLSILSKIKTDEVGKMSDEVFDGSKPENREMMRLMWQTFTPAQMGRLAQDKSNVMEDMKSVLETTPGGIELSPSMYNYLASTTAQGLGLSLPANTRRPQTLATADLNEAERDLRQKQDEIARLGEESDLFRARGMADEADRRLTNAKNAIEKEMPLIEQKIQRLNQELDNIDAQRAAAATAAGRPAPAPRPAPTPPPPITPQPGTDPLGLRGSIVGSQIPKSWVDDAWRNLEAGGGTPIQKTIFTARIDEAEKRRQLAEELARGYNAGRY